MAVATERETWAAPEGHVILEAYEKEHRVSSDHAWLDSGSGFAIVTWNGKRKCHHYENTGWGDGPYPKMPTPNASPAEIAAAGAYSAAYAMLKEVFDTAEKAHYIKPGVTLVEVIAGRKVPKGTYLVTKHYNGSYHPCVDLANENGRAYDYRFVNVENVKVIPNYKKAFKANPKTAHNALVPFFVAMMTEGIETGIGILADFIENSEFTFKNGHSATDFANALRELAPRKDGNPRFSTVYADCHNEFRKLFYGV